jgi:hypothetical protein
MENGLVDVFPADDMLNAKGFIGLTKRELFAAMAMQGIIGNPGTNGFGIYAAVAESAVEQADALLAALEGKGG